MKKLDLQSSYIYGPINSRRLGVSLGINLSPTRYKLCSFDCLYCQYGFTDIKTLKYADAADIPDCKQVIDEFCSVLKQAEQKSIKFDYITFAGNGEPTVHPEFCAIAREIMSIRDEMIPSTKIAVLSNASCITDEQVKIILGKLDDAIIKLDAGDEEMFEKINRPDSQVKFRDVLSGLKSLDNVTLQTLFVNGIAVNSSDEHVDKLIDCYNYIQPRMVQIYSLDRAPAEPLLLKVSKERLYEIKKRISGKLPDLNIAVY